MGDFKRRGRYLYFRLDKLKEIGMMRAKLDLNEISTKEESLTNSKK